MMNLTVVSLNVFTLTLLRSIQQSQLLQAQIEMALNDASSIHAAAEVSKAWFEALFVDLVDKMEIGRHVDPQFTQVFSGFIQNVFSLIA
jgi:hypothetical protein